MLNENTYTYLKKKDIKYIILSVQQTVEEVNNILNSHTFQ